jgi:ABC-type transport system involved in multi-copper enzyme maturation permease subunit
MNTADTRTVNWPAPLKPPGLLRGLLEIVRLGVEQLFFSRRTLLLALLAALPVALAAGTVAAKNWLDMPALSSPAQLYAVLFNFVYLHLLLFAVPLLHAMSLIADEVEGKTLTCLLTRPVPKSVILVGKLLAYGVVASMLLGPSLVLSYVVLHGPAGLGPEGARALLRDLTVIGAGLLVYGAIFALFGLALKRSLMVGLVFILWESFFAYVPGLFHKLTALHYLQAYSRIASERGWALALLGERTSAGQATIVLAAAFAVLVLVAVGLFQNLEYRQPAAGV